MFFILLHTQTENTENSVLYCEQETQTNKTSHKKLNKCRKEVKGKNDNKKSQKLFLRNEY